MSIKDGLPCIRCGTNEWYKNGDCKVCTRKRTQAWKRSNRDKHRANCRNWQKLNGKKPTTPEEIAISRQYKKRWKRNNPDKVKAATHKRRARIKGNGGQYSEQEWKELCNFYSNKCLCCGRDDVRLSVDHVVPIDKGGTNSIDNIQPLCLKCNMRKRTKIIDYRKERLQHFKQMSLFD